MKGQLFLQKIGEEFNLTYEHTYEHNEEVVIIGTTSEKTPFQYKLSKTNCDKIIGESLSKIEVDIKQSTRLSLNTGRFQRMNQEDNDGCIILEKLF